METTKQKAIREVFGFLNEMIDENGWATYGCDEAHEFGIEPFGEYETRKHKDGIYEWRPKSLQGIETNNGWIKIESEADLNLPDGEYFGVFPHDYGTDNRIEYFYRIIYNRQNASNGFGNNLKQITYDAKI